MNAFSAWLESNLGLSPEIQLNLLLSALGLLLLWVLRRWISHLLARRINDPKTLYTWQRIIGSVYYVLALFLLAQLWLRNLANLVTYFGLLSAGLAIALKDPLTNVFAWIFILWRRPFVVGDRIQIGENIGDVVDLRIFQFSLLEIGNWVKADQTTGRIIHVPNGKVFTEHLANYTSGFDYLWNELPVMVTFESDWQNAKLLLEQIVGRHAATWSEAAAAGLQQASRKLLIHYESVTPVVYTSVEASGVTLTLRYMCPARQRRTSAHALWEEILLAFEGEADIEFAYPTTRFYDAHTENGSPS